MAVSVDYENRELILFINGINFNMLDPAGLKAGFTEEERCDPDFTKFFKRYFIPVDENERKWGL